MSNIRSHEVKRALKMIEKGATAYAAAKKHGITPAALYKLDDYKAIMAARKQPEKN